MKDNEIKLGSKVRDVISSFEGIAVSRIVYLTGCTQYGVAPKVDKEGKVPDTHYFDYKRLKVLKEPVEIPSEDTGGPNRGAPR